MKMKFTGSTALPMRVSKNELIFGMLALISGERGPENLGKMAKTWKSVVMQIRGWSISIENTGLYSLVSHFYHSVTMSQIFLLYISLNLCNSGSRKYHEAVNGHHSNFPCSFIRK